MKYKIFLFRLLTITILGGILFFYTNNFAPYRADGSMDAISILIVLSLITLLLFFVLQTILYLFLNNSLSTKISVIGSFAFMQFLLINASNSFNLGFILFIAVFNLFFFWYVIKAF